MKVIDPGHIFQVDVLDPENSVPQVIVYVKREGNGYPGNEGHYQGTNLQEVFRTAIARLQYLDSQETCLGNHVCIKHLRNCIRELEFRAACRHGRSISTLIPTEKFEDLPTCEKCGHVGCPGSCHGSTAHT